MSSEADLHSPRPFCDWHEDHGNVLWWSIPIVEPPYVGTALDEEFDNLWPPGRRFNLWWTPLPDAKRIEDQVPL